MRLGFPFQHGYGHHILPEILLYISAELKQWSLLMMGTSTHPQMHEITPPANSDQPFTCSGITSHGVCIGLCILWFFCYQLLSCLLSAVFLLS